MKQIEKVRLAAHPMDYPCSEKAKGMALVIFAVLTAILLLVSGCSWSRPTDSMSPIQRYDTGNRRI